MIMKNLIPIAGLVCLFAVLLSWADASVVMESGMEQHQVEAQEAPLSKVLEKIWNKYGVDITGLEGRNDERVTFSLKGETLEELLKRLFRYLGETNYAFEFADGKLDRVSVLPKSKITDDAPSIPSDRKEKKVQKQFSAVVKVKGVLKGTNAEELGLKEGDLIISYGGVRIHSAQRLVRETKKKTGEEIVEMTVVRNREPMTFHLERGFIGVRIHTVKIPKEELGE
jgi:C-terminal processing protease CtpA/Prc